MRAAVIGGSGFIGTHVVAKLLDAGHQVTVVDRHARQEFPEARYVRADVLGPGLAEHLDQAEVVFHLAAEADVDAGARDPLEMTRVNVLGTAAALEAARQIRARRYFLASTVWVYAAADGVDPVPEDAALRPEAVDHVYTAGKIACEMLVCSYRRLYGLDYTILRYGIPYGPGMREELVIHRFVRQALAGEAITISGDGSQYRQYVWVEDLADAHVLALSDGARNQTIALEGTEPVSIRDIAEAIRSLVGNVEITYQPPRPGDFSGRRIEARRAQEILGWRPTTTFAEGLREYVAWYRRRSELAVGGRPA